MNKKGAIGIFDSGVGGTSIWKEIHSLLPFEDTIYLADSKYAPYGNRSREEIIYLSKKNTEYLLNLNCKIIVVACNTATTNAIKVLRESYDIPFIGIEPAIKPAALHSKTKNIGILATKGTLSSELFHKTSELFTKGINVTEVIGEGLVPIIEDGLLESPEMHKLLQKHLQPIIKANADYLVLGCSHYPYLIPQLRKLLPENVTIIDSGEAVAKQTKAILAKNELLFSEDRTPKLQFFTNAKTDTLELLLKDFSEEISIEKKAF